MKGKSLCVIASSLKKVQGRIESYPSPRHVILYGTHISFLNKIKQEKRNKKEALG